MEKLNNEKIKKINEEFIKQAKKTIETNSLIPKDKKKELINEIETLGYAFIIRYDSNSLDDTQEPDEWTDAMIPLFKMILDSLINKEKETKNLFSFLYN